MPTKKKKAGHTDYRTGGMFYPKFDAGGVNVAGYNKAADYAKKFRTAEKNLAIQKKKDKETLRAAANLTSGQTWEELTPREKIGLKRAEGIPLTHEAYVKKYFPKMPTDKATRDYLANTRFDTEK